MRVGGLAFLLFAGIVGCGKSHTTPVVYEIPVSFSGWVVIEYEVASAPPLPKVGDELVVVVPLHGYVATSSRQELGILHERFVAVDPEGRRTPLVDASRDRVTGPDAANRTYPEPIVCCRHHGVSRFEDGPERKFAGFYVGRGPAGEPPDWPITER